MEVLSYEVSGNLGEIPWGCWRARWSWFVNTQAGERLDFHAAPGHMDMAPLIWGLICSLVWRPRPAQYEPRGSTLAQYGMFPQNLLHLLCKGKLEGLCSSFTTWYDTIWSSTEHHNRHTDIFLLNSVRLGWIVSLELGRVLRFVVLDLLHLVIKKATALLC